MRANLTDFTLFDASGNEEVWADAGGFVVNMITGGHAKGLKRPQVICSCFRALLRAYFTDFTLLDASGTNGRRYRGGRHH